MASKLHNALAKKLPDIQMSEAFINCVFLAMSGGLQDAYTYFTRNEVFSIRIPMLGGNISSFPNIFPSISTVPVTLIRPAIARISIVLPLPFFPLKNITA